MDQNSITNSKYIVMDFSKFHGKIERKFELWVFRAIFDLSNKIALLILLRMFALYVKKKKEQKIEN